MIWSCEPRPPQNLTHADLIGCTLRKQQHINELSGSNAFEIQTVPCRLSVHQYRMIAADRRHRSFC